MKTKLTTQKNLNRGKSSKNTSVKSSKDKNCKWFQGKKKKVKIQTPALRSLSSCVSQKLKMEQTLGQRIMDTAHGEKSGIQCKSMPKYHE